MARADLAIIGVLRMTARKIIASDQYQWGHMGACNCGYLAQEITQLSREEIHQRAMQGYGDWTEQLNDYCPASGLPMDDLISRLISFGFDTDDLKHLERLSDPCILGLVGEDQKLRHNTRSDVALYLTTWAMMLEEQMLSAIQLPDLNAIYTLSLKG